MIIVDSASSTVTLANDYGIEYSNLPSARLNRTTLPAIVFAVCRACVWVKTMFIDSANIDAVAM
jgi:hypothetical protein